MLCVPFGDTTCVTVCVCVIRASCDDVMSINDYCLFLTTACNRMVCVSFDECVYWYSRFRTKSIVCYSMYVFSDDFKSASVLYTYEIMTRIF